MSSIVPPGTQRTFRFDKATYTYAVFDVAEAPSSNFGVIGDISVLGKNRWIREESKWVEVLSGVRGAGERPIQCHPVHKGRVRLDGDSWKSTSSFNPKKKRKIEEIKIDEDDEPSPAELLTAPHTVAQNPAPQCNNGWILTLLQRWNCSPIINLARIHPIGECILKELLHHPVTIPKASSGGLTLFLADETPAFVMAPTGQRVINDLITSTLSNVWDFGNRYIEPNVKPSEVLASILQASEGTLSPDSHIFGVLDIPSSEGGICSCLIDAAPFSDKTYGYVDKYGWSSTLTPPGAVSQVHMDFYGSRQFMVHIQGQKLWILWPPTSKNLEWYKSFHKERASSDLTVNAIQNLEGLELYYLDGGQPTAFTLQPNTLHACISVSTSMHTAIKVWSYDAFPESRRLMEWGLDWVRGATSIKVLDTISDQLVVMEEEIEGWDLLTKQNTRKAENGPIKVALKSWRDAVKNMKSSLI